MQKWGCLGYLCLFGQGPYLIKQWSDFYNLGHLVDIYWTVLWINCNAAGGELRCWWLVIRHRHGFRKVLVGQFWLVQQIMSEFLLGIVFRFFKNGRIFKNSRNCTCKLFVWASWSILSLEGSNFELIFLDKDLGEQ